jgi:hypothetical protein
MQILDLVFSRQLFECPCVVGEFFVKFSENGLVEDEDWSDLIQYQLRDMTNSEKQEIGFSVESPAPAPTAKTRKRREPVTLEGAARIVGRTSRTVRAWEAGNSTPEGWPGRGDAVVLKAWANRRTEQGKLKRALHNIGRGGGDMSRHAAPRPDDTDEERED